jgi:autonomous glycyl radical cofactor GrcA
VSESDYFLKLLEMCEMTRNAEIEARESGKEFQPELRTEETQQLTSNSSREQRIKEMSNDEYLKQSVMPVLYQGMKSVTAHRPKQPLKYLAYWLLKH